MDEIAAYEHELLVYATERLATVPGLRIIGQAKEKAAVISFVLDDAHPHDIGTCLDGEGVAVRAGHHCAQPLMKRMGVPATARIFALHPAVPSSDALRAAASATDVVVPLRNARALRKPPARARPENPRENAETSTGS